MAEGEGKAGDGGKDYPGFFGFLNKVWDTIWGGPVPQSLFIIGMVLIVLYAFGGIPKVQTFTAQQSANVLIIGILAIVAALVTQITRSAGSQGHMGEFRYVLPFMVIAGVAFPTVVLLSHFGIIASPKSDSLRADLDVVVIGLALASWCGFIPAYLTAYFLKARSQEIKDQVKTIDEQLNRLKQSEDELLVHLKESENQLVNHVEDATRSLLKGFDSVFTRALSMISEAQDQLILVNFAVNFGSPHRYNDEVVRKYAECNRGASFSRDVDDFLGKLRARIVSVPFVQILTISDEGATDNFLTPLAARRGYEGLQAKFSEELATAKRSKKDIKDRIRLEGSPRADGRLAKCLLEVESLPIQLLITGLPPRGGSQRTGCLVFMVGTEMLNTEIDPGSEPAFYTELDNMVQVFRNLALALMDSARKKADQTRA